MLDFRVGKRPFSLLYVIDEVFEQADISEYAWKKFRICFSLFPDLTCAV